MNSQQFTGWLECQFSLDPLSEKPLLNVDEYSAYGKNYQRPLIMAVLNVTPDSFSDGGRFLSKNRACDKALHLISEGADLIDVGGESTRPGAEPVSLDVELNRVIPVIEQIRAYSDVCISIDTNKPEVMEAAVSAGADIINDIYALRREGALAMAAQLEVPVCLMHMQGEPQTMQINPHYPEGVLEAVTLFFTERIAACKEAGIDAKRLILDPGFGFGKKVQDNLLLIKALDHFAGFAMPLLLGVSRKSTIGAVLNKEVKDRLIGSITLSIYAALKGIGIIRTHEVNETKQALDMIHMISHI